MKKYLIMLFVLMFLVFPVRGEYNISTYDNFSDGTLNNSLFINYSTGANNYGLEISETSGYLKLYSRADSGIDGSYAITQVNTTNLFNITNNVTNVFIEYNMLTANTGAAPTRLFYIYFGNTTIPTSLTNQNYSIELWLNGSYVYYRTKEGTGSFSSFINTHNTKESNLSFYNQVSEIGATSNGYTEVKVYYIQYTNLTDMLVTGSCDYNFLSIPNINYTFKNETLLQERVTAIVNGQFYYNKNGRYNSFSYTNTSGTNSFTICSLPYGRNINLNGTIQYYNSASAMRTYQENTTLVEPTVNTTLYLLPSSVGLYTAFQVVDGAFTPIPGAIVTINRTGYGPIASALTDGSGLASFFLDPTATYNIYATAATYSSFSTSLMPTQSSYTINLGTGTLSSSTTITNYNNGITYRIKPTQTYLLNRTNYVFNFTISSSVYALDEFGFSLLNNSNQVIANSSSSNSSGGYVGLTTNTGSNTLIKLNAYWKVNGTYMNISKTYYITDNEGTDYSIKYFINRLLGYMENSTDDDGLYGVKKTDDFNFNFSVIVFLIIFMFAGIFSFKYGFTSPSSIMLFVLVAVWFFEVTTELIDVLPNSSVPFLTIVTAMVFLITFIREVQ